MALRKLAIDEIMMVSGGELGADTSGSRGESGTDTGSSSNPSPTTTIGPNGERIVNCPEGYNLFGTLNGDFGCIPAPPPAPEPRETPTVPNDVDPNTVGSNDSYGGSCSSGSTGTDGLW
jgi:hypothetical protein